MKRGLVLTLGLAVAAMIAAPALAAVNVQLNLRYTDPNNATGGGTWDLLVQSSAANGLAGIALDITGDLGVTGVDLPAAKLTPNNSVFNNTTSVFRYTLKTNNADNNLDVTHVVAGDDLAGTLITGVGKGGVTPGNVANDDLFPTSPAPGSTKWDNSALMFSGSWLGTRPTLSNILVNEFDATAPTPKAVAGTVTESRVRGDSVGVDGLKPGDANRDGTVTAADFSALSGNYQQPGPGATKTWDQGDFNSTSGGVNEVSAADFSALSGNYSPPNGPANAPPITAAPEPSSFALLGMALLGLGRCARRR